MSFRLFVAFFFFLEFFALNLCSCTGGDKDHPGDAGDAGDNCFSHEDCPGFDPDTCDLCCGCEMMCYEGKCGPASIDHECCFRGDCNENCKSPCGDHIDCDWRQRCDDHECLNCRSLPSPPYCHKDLAEVSCATHGGLWMCSNTGGCKCSCSTEDEGCNCKSHADCRSYCVAETIDGGCQDIADGACYAYEYLETACYCVPSESIEFELLCID